jgi:hypothetical protein
MIWIYAIGALVLGALFGLLAQRIFGLSRGKGALFAALPFLATFAYMLFRMLTGQANSSGVLSADLILLPGSLIVAVGAAILCYTLSSLSGTKSK